MISYTDEEIEESRQDELARLAERYGSVEAAEQTANIFGVHEAMHLAFVLCETFDHYVLNSPVCILNPTVWHIAHEAHTALFNLYQALGSVEYDLETKTE